MDDLVSEDFDRVELYTHKYQAPAEDYWKHIARLRQLEEQQRRRYDGSR